MPRHDSPFGVRVQPGRILVTWGDVQFEIADEPQEIVYHSATGSDDVVFEYLVPQLLSFALLQRGIESIHGTALRYRERAIVLVGDSGHGKSTLAAAMIHAGAQLITDDLVAIVDGCVLPGVQRIKLTPEIARATIGEREGIAMDDERGKWIYRTLADETCDVPTQLQRIVILEPRAQPLQLQPLKGVNAFRALAAATFNPLITTDARMRAHAQFMTRLVNEYPILQLTLPHDLALLDEAARLTMK